MSVNIAQEVASKVAVLPWEQQRAILRLVETMAGRPPVAESVETDDPYTVPALVTDKAERAQLLRNLVERMDANPIPADAPRFTREELHERR